MEQTLQEILTVAGAIGIIGGAGAVIWKVILPVVRIVKRVEELERRSEKDFERINRGSEYDKIICTAMIALLEHAETGNATGKMAKARSELMQFIIDN